MTLEYDDLERRVLVTIITSPKTKPKEKLDAIHKLRAHDESSDPWARLISQLPDDEVEMWAIEGQRDRLTALLDEEAEAIELFGDSGRSVLELMARVRRLEGETGVPDFQRWRAPAESERWEKERIDRERDAQQARRGRRLDGNEPKREGQAPSA